MDLNLLKQNLIEQIPNNVRIIMRELAQKNYESFIVGGCVRDAVLGRVPHDWDITTSATPQEVKSIFNDYIIVDSGIKYGTITIIMYGEKYEITTFRAETSYSDGRHPDSIKFASTIKEDLSRRDFTMNAIAFNPLTGFVDPYHGLNDINDKIIRCVGNAKERFSEDALRILRMYRFSVQLKFSIDSKTEDAAIKNLKLLHNISAERKRDELIKAISGDKISFILASRCFLHTIIPEWKNMKFPQNNKYHLYDVQVHSEQAFYAVEDNGDVIIRLATLLHDIGKPHCYQDDVDGTRHFRGHGEKSAEMTEEILRRLHCPNEITLPVVELVRYHDAILIDSKPSIRRWINKIGVDQFARLLKIRQADILAQNPLYKDERLVIIDKVKALYYEILEEASMISLKDLEINGQDLIDLGFPKGKLIGVALDTLLNEVIDEKLANTKWALTQRVLELKEDLL